jgi:membrane-associated HD superfamily phosphohydrolase
MYLKYLEDNLNHKFTKEMDEYKNYVKMFYNEKAKCPKDLKTPLQRTQDDKKIELWCNNWKVSIIKPVVVNLKFLQESLSIIYKKNSDLFKYKLRQNMNSSTYKPDDDNEVRDMLVELKKIEEEINSIKSIFEKQKEIIDEIIKKKKNTLKNLAEIKIKKENKYNECIDISKDVFIKLKEISKNEENITEQRFTQISKSVKLSIKETKNWIEYFKFIIAYIKENDILYQSNQILIDLQNKFENINANYIIEPPKISTK